MKKILFTCSFLLFFTATFSQNPTEETGTWNLIAGKHQISEKLSIPTVGIIQTYDLYQKLHFGFFRTGLTYKLTDQINATLGYAYLHLEPYDLESGSILRRHIIYEEVNLKSNYKKLNIFHRYRFESNFDTKADNHDRSHRMRYRLRLTHPIYKKLYAAVFDEILIVMDEPYFNQNRFSAGLGYTFNPNLTMELGYFKVHFATKNFDRIRLALIFKTSFLKSKK